MLTDISQRWDVGTPHTMGEDNNKAKVHDTIDMKIMSRKWKYFGLGLFGWSE